MAPPEIGTSFTVEISSTAWKQLSTLPLEMYQRVRTELDFNAAALLSALPPAGPADADQVLPTRDFVVEGYVASLRPRSPRKKAHPAFGGNGPEVGGSVNGA